MPQEKRLRIHPEIRRRAVEQRHSMTRSEALLWEALRNRRLGGFKFRRQHPLGQFIVDFYCAESNLVVEVDGLYHLSQPEYDAERTECLKTSGYRVLRFSNDMVDQRLAETTQAILLACEEWNPEKQE